MLTLLNRTSLFSGMPNGVKCRSSTPTLFAMVGLWLGLSCSCALAIEGGALPATPPISTSAEANKASSPFKPATTGEEPGLTSTHPTLVNESKPAVTASIPNSPQPSQPISATSGQTEKTDPSKPTALNPIVEIVWLAIYTLALLAVGVAAFFFVRWFARSLQLGETPSFEVNWGGLGGGLSGWKMNGSLSYFLGSVIFAALFCSMVFQGPLRPSLAKESGPPPAKPASDPPENKKEK